MSCLKCDTLLSQEELTKKIKCDYCKNQYCQSCSKLSSTEVRCMAPGKRLIKYVCEQCLKEDTNKDGQVQLLNGNSEMVEIKDNLKKELNAIKNEMLTSIADLKTQVDLLKESNIELIHLVAPKPNKSNLETMNYSSVLQSSKASDVTLPTLPNSSSTQPLIINEPKTCLSKPMSQKTKGSFQYGSHNHLEKEPNRAHSQAIQDETMDDTNSNLDVGYQVMKRRRRKLNFGSGEGDPKFHGNISKERKIWLFVTRVPDDVNAVDIKDYIESHTNVNNTPNQAVIKRDIEVSKLKTMYSRPNNQSFMIGVEPELLDVVYKSNFWPKKIAFERFNFKRGQHFLKNAQVNQDSEQPNSFLEKTT